MPREYITTQKKLQDLLDGNDNKPALSRAKVLGVHFQFAEKEGQDSEKDRVVVITTASNSPDGTAVVLQLDLLDKNQVVNGVRTLLADPAVVKVMCGVQRVALWLQRYGLANAELSNCVDLQLVYQHSAATKAPHADLLQIASHLGPSSNAARAQKVNTFTEKLKPQAWKSTTLSPELLKALVQTTQVYVRCYRAKFGDDPSVRMAAMTNQRWCSAIGVRSNGDLHAKASEGMRKSGALDDSETKAKVPASSTNPVESTCAIMYIDAEPRLQSLLDKNSNKPVASQATTVGVHFHFAGQSNSGAELDDGGCMVAITVASAAPSDPAVVLQLDLLSNNRVVSGLKTLLADPAIVKVMHSVHRAAFWLHQYGLRDAELVNCVDLQLLYEHSVDTTELHADMLKIAAHCFPETNVAQSMHSFKTKLKPVEPEAWSRRPLATPLLQTLARTAQLYAKCFAEFPAVAASGSLDLSDTSHQIAWPLMMAARWHNAVLNCGHAAIWFDPTADNQPRSLECLAVDDSRSGEGATVSSIELSRLELQCDLEPLLELLPEAYRTAIVSIENFRERLVDICLDVGRTPYVYMGKRQRVVLVDDGSTITKETLEDILNSMGGEQRIGDDNRAGIDRQLHRISVMRSKTQEVYGLTMRVGRALLNAACVLTDLLLSEAQSGKSVLVLGHPGSGKTTLIRDVARCVSETMENVCIIDTSNEIGGDGLVPHDCVGWARRMMVRTLEEQASVMIECVQNHTVETLVIDEIGRKAEVMAASTVRQRGPRLIASAHGDFRALIKNPDLKGLIGGAQQVIVGDSAAAQSTNKNKLQTKRAGNPIFDVIVELDHVERGRCRIIWDVAKAVDSVLEGNGYTFETRKWDVNTA
ncbi:hypothetical protein BBJ28_00012976, partial [Nothophytophthora sp. Chile5]